MDMDNFCPDFPLQEEDDRLASLQNTTIPTSYFDFQQQQQHPTSSSALHHQHHPLINYYSSSAGSLLDAHHAPPYISFPNSLPLGTFNDGNSNDVISHMMMMNSSSSSASASNNDVNLSCSAINEEQKKSIHKEIERRRRHEMATLYSSLRSLLPLDSIKRRGSTSDLIHEAENHIKQKQKNIEELTVRRDGLRSWRAAAAANEYHNIERSSSAAPCGYLGGVDISVRPNLGGMEILITSDDADYLMSSTSSSSSAAAAMADTAFPLSRVLQLLVAQGLTVLSCVCTKVNGKLLHAIHTDEVSRHAGGVDVYDLSQKLGDLFADNTTPITRPGT